MPSTTVCEIFGTLQQVPRFAVVLSLSLAAAAGGPACVPGATPLVFESMALTARGAREKDTLSTVIYFIALVGNTCLKNMSSTRHGASRSSCFLPETVAYHAKNREESPGHHSRPHLLRPIDNVALVVFLRVPS